ncbi:MAG TPA: tetratricopeptide repeat protein [Ignavibacteria bacterium]|nr:tetratricopeptide repeat protein [Ignavibacteria bacterium]
MVLHKKVYLLFVSLVILSGTVYYMGCSSAQSTTGKLAFQQQEFAKAEEELKKGLAIDQNDDEGWYMLGYSQIELGKLDEAKSSFKKCLSISNNYSDQINRFWVEKFNKGAQSFKDGIDAENKKDSAGARSFYQQALTSFTASSAIIPDSLKSLSAMGETYLALGEQDKALGIFNELASKSSSVEASEKVARIIFDAGVSMMSLKSYDTALETFKRVLTVPNLPKNDPYYETASYNCALALAKIGEGMRTKDDGSDYKAKFSEALTYLEPLTTNLTKKDLEPLIYDLLVSVYANLGETDKAQDALKKKDSLQK